MRNWHRRALIAVGFGMMGTLLLLGWAKHTPCFYFNNESKDLPILLLILWSLTFSVVVPSRGHRVVWTAGGICTVLIAAAFALGHIDRPYAAWSLRESAITALRADVRALRQYHVVNLAYPEHFDPTPQSEYLRKYFDMRYFPVLDPNGTVGAYRIEVRPAHPPCGCPLSFTVNQDGKVFSTEEARAATDSDRLVSVLSR